MAKTDTILAAAQAAGLGIRSGCIFGVCGTCKPRTLAAEVHMVQNDWTSWDDIAAGFLRACCSTPIGKLLMQAQKPTRKAEGAPAMHSPDTEPSPFWMAILVAAAILFSFALACGMPFAALGALAALTLTPRDAALLAGIGWLANQAVGFGFLGYPLDPLTLAWGVALGLSAIAAVAAALVILRLAHDVGPLLRLPLAFVAAWVGQQGAVLAASLVLGGTASAFAPAVVWFIFWTNAAAFVVLLAAQAFGAWLGVARLPMTQPIG